MPALRSTRMSAALAAIVAVTLVPAHASAQGKGVFAFENVTVVPMDRETTLPGRTVIVRDGRIVSVVAAGSAAVPAGATRIDGRGRFLMPGIAEMHGHIPPVGNAGARYAEDALFMYLANGATTVRGMQGNASQFELRRRIEAGEIPGPRLYLGSPPLSGNNAKDPESARRLVREHRTAGYDLLKVHEGLSRETYAAIVETAREVGMTWGGHVASDVGVSGALAAHQVTIDHIDDYIDALQKDGSPALALDGFARADAMPMNVDESKYAVLARQTREAGVAVVPTSALWETILGVHPTAELMRRPELKYMPRAMVEGWATTIDRRRADRDRASAALEVTVRNRMLKALDDGGALVLMGTDAPQLFSVPGFSLRNELAVMKQAGMSNHAILRSGTTNVAKYFGTEAETGTVAEGKRADLLLLDANPLDDALNIWRRAGVMANGRWYPESEIQRKLAEIEARNR